MQDYDHHSRRKCFNRACLLPICRGERFMYAHRIPTVGQRRQAWLKALSDPFLEHILNPTICGRHFRPEDYIHPNSHKLNRVAVPCLNLKDLSQLNMCRRVSSVMMKRNPVARILSAVEESNANRISRHLESSAGQSNNGIEMLEESEDSEEIMFVQVVDAAEDNQEEVMHVQQNAEVQNAVNNNLVENELIGENRIITDNISGFTIRIVGQELLLQHVDYAEELNLDFLCLHDSCKCSNCYDSVTQTRLHIFADLQPCSDLDIVTLYPDKLFIKWNGNHISEYTISELFNAHKSPQMHINHLQIPWVSMTAIESANFRCKSFNDLICNANTLSSAFQSLQHSGVLLVSEVCTLAEQKPFMLEFLLRRLFPNSNQCWVKEERNRFPDSYRLPHTNCTFLSESCGLQILSITPKCGAETVQLTLVDGCSVASKLYFISPNTFNYLSKKKIPLVYSNAENFDYATEASTIQLSEEGIVERIQFAPYHRANKMPKESLPSCVKALNRITSIVEQKDLQCKLLLRKDELLILDNWRILWQIEPDANVALDCVYVERKHFLSRLNRKD